MEKNQYLAPNIESETIENLTRQLVTANNELQKMQKERGEMLANISHDLRAPLTAIRSATNLLLSAESISREELVSTLQIIDRRTATLENLIQDMYYLFCVEDTGRELKLETLHAANLLEEYFFDAAVDSRYKEHHLHLDLPDDLDCFIHIDTQKFIRVLDNLFTNAAKYTPEGSDITLKARTKDARLIVSVMDNGEGIPAEAVEKIFERTYTVSDARTPGETAGSGLGLAIVKAVTERFGGSVCCESTLGKGTSFHISLPVVHR